MLLSGCEDLYDMVSPLLDHGTEKQANFINEWAQFSMVISMVLAGNFEWNLRA